MVYLLKIGIILILSIFFGELASRFKLPRLIGYLAGGFILGPSTFDFLDREFLNSSQFLKEFSLAFILFVIGTKIKGERIKNIGSGLLWIAFFEISITIILVSIGFFLFIGNILYAIIIAVVATATAPAATAMITEEYHSEGPFTDSLLFIVGIDNLVVLILFNLFAPIFLGIGGFSYFEGAFFGLIASIFLGVFMGIGVSYLESRITEAEDTVFFLIGLGFFFTGLGLTSLLRGYPLIFAIFMGVAVANSSLKNYKALEEVFYIKSAIYIFFFFVAGASLHLDTIREMRWAVMLYILLRGFGKIAGSYIGAIRGRLEDVFKGYTGIGLLTNAGLATGLAIYIGDKGGEVGHKMMNVILSGTIVFEIFGPLLLRWALVKAGEVKVIHIMKKGMEPVLDSDFHSVLHELSRAFGLTGIFARKMTEDTRIKHIMRKNFVFLSPGDHLQEIVKAFDRSHTNALPVISGNNQFHGMVHLRELEHLFLNEVTERLIVAEDLVIQSHTLSPEDQPCPH